MLQSTPRPVPTNSEKYEIAAANPRALARVLSHVEYDNDCWIWTGATNDRGYAVMTSNKQSVYAHRLTHWIVVGPVPEGHVLDHLCRRPACVNPLHTEAVTSAENTRRGEGNGSRSSCPSGHPYDTANTRYNIDKRGYSRRMCIACQNMRNAARRAMNAA